MTYQDIITSYKQLLNGAYLEGEKYKWQLIQKHKGKPNLDAEDLLTELKSIEYGNLIYHTAFTVRNELVNFDKEAYRTLLRNLFNEDMDLQIRIDNFKGEINKLYRRSSPSHKLPDHHDERTIATMLTFHNPEKYILYKSSFYSKLVKSLGIKKAKAGQRYVHYLELAKDFIDNYLSNDTELINLVKSKLPQDAYEDKNLTLLCQDIFYQVMDLQSSTNTFKTIVEEVKSLMEENEILQNFRLLDEHSKYGKSESYIWISDSHNIIGDIVAHYELQNDELEYVYVDIHFEGSKEQSLIFNYEIKSLPEKLKWIEWSRKTNSIRYNEKFMLNDKECADKIVDALLYMENNIGNEVRDIIKKNFKKDNPTNIFMSHPLNQIFYGSPGTGKTYNTVNTALEIINENEEHSLDFSDREAVKKLFDQRVKEGRILFTTFHQSMTYEDFIEGIKPETLDGNVVYEITEGIFKSVCEKAKATKISNFDEAYQRLLNEIENLDDGILELKTPTNKSFWVSINSKNNLSLITGVNKTKQGTLIKSSIEKEANGEKYFLGWEGYAYGVVNHLKSKHNLQTSNGKSDKVPNYVIIIDEINRGNVSAIFGELITLIEESKRQGNIEALEVILPYSKEKFSVPKNVYIIGTMNTADRSVEALDTALRRRFSFVEMQPNLQFLNKFYSDWYYANFDALWNLSWNDPIWVSFEERFVSILVDSEAYTNISDKEVENFYKSNKSTKEFSNFFSSKGIKYLPVEVLRVINDRIEYLLNKDHTIGHSYFLEVNSIEDLRISFFKNILPLLQEYFYGDYAKMSLVIGQGFFEKKKSMKDIIWAITDNNIEKPEREVWNLKTSMTDDEFRDAINLLLGKKNES